jgi:hypothetical protein
MAGSGSGDVMTRRAFTFTCCAYVFTTSTLHFISCTVDKEVFG